MDALWAMQGTEVELALAYRFDGDVAAIGNALTRFFAKADAAGRGTAEVRLFCAYMPNLAHADSIATEFGGEELLVMTKALVQLGTPISPLDDGGDDLGPLKMQLPNRYLTPADLVQPFEAGTARALEDTTGAYSAYTAAVGTEAACSDPADPACGEPAPVSGADFGTVLTFLGSYEQEVENQFEMKGMYLPFV